MESVDDLMRWLMVNPLEETDFLELQSATAPAQGEQWPETGQPQGQRDLPVSSEDVTEFIQSEKNTIKNTDRDVRNVERWLWETQPELREIQEIPQAESDEYLSKIWISLRKQDGTEYEPSSLTQIKYSIERYLKEKTAGEISLRSKEFTKSNQALAAKLIDLKQKGKGGKPNKAQALTPAEEQIFWDKKN